MQNDQHDKTNPIVTTRDPSAQTWIRRGCVVTRIIFVALLHPDPIQRVRQTMDGGAKAWMRILASSLLFRPVILGVNKSVDNQDADPELILSILYAFHPCLRQGWPCTLFTCSRTFVRVHCSQILFGIEHGVNTPSERIFTDPKRGRRLRRRPLFGL